jgi:hypothetical protein
MALTAAGEALLRPVLGPWEQSRTWFHQMDDYGDGVRMRALPRGIPPRQLPSGLQAPLAGVHEPFVILCIVGDDLSAPGDSDCLAPFSQRTLVTRRRANALSLGAAA